MAQQAQVAEDSFERIQAMFRSVEEEFDKLSGRVSSQRKKLEKTTQKRVKRVRTQMKKNPVYKQAESLRKETNKWFDETNKQIEKNVDQLLGTFNIATRSDIQKLDRKLNRINKKLKELDQLP